MSRTDQMTPDNLYKYRSVAPDMPPIDSYMEDLRFSYSVGWFTNFGPLSRRLESELAHSFGMAGETCVCVSNATAGLSASLIASSRSGQILVPAFTFPASLSAIRAAGLEPVVMDVSADTWTVSVECLRAALDRFVAAAVMLVSPFGLQCDFSEHIDLCLDRGIAVIIDSAAGLGVSRPQRNVHKDVFEVYSMHATKPFSIGEGGVVFAHPDRDEALRAALNFSLLAPERPDLPEWGFNGKLSEFHAAVGLAQLRLFSDRVVGRQAFVRRYVELLSEDVGLTMISDPRKAPWQVFPVLMPSREACESAIASAAARGLELRRYYRPSLSRWPRIRLVGDCRVSEDLADRMCVLPVRSNPDGSEADEIINIAVGAMRAAVEA
jgi:dTDP-4-amino-4,6-dideoxygalactose transaminase